MARKTLLRLCFGTAAAILIGSACSTLLLRESLTFHVGRGILKHETSILGYAVAARSEGTDISVEYARLQWHGPPLEVYIWDRGWWDTRIPGNGWKSPSTRGGRLLSEYHSLISFFEVNDLADDARIESLRRAAESARLTGSIASEFSTFEKP